jgi:hypothetical protein
MCFYYESMKRNLLKPTYECRCNGRLQTKIFTRLAHTGFYSFEVYYESIKREPKIRGINKCRFDERLQTKTKEFTRLPYTGLGSPTSRAFFFFKRGPGLSFTSMRSQQKF